MRNIRYVLRLHTEHQLAGRQIAQSLGFITQHRHEHAPSDGGIGPELATNSGANFSFLPALAMPSSPSNTACSIHATTRTARGVAGGDNDQIPLPAPGQTIVRIHRFVAASSLMQSTGCCLRPR
jgi:hypothetical protein